MPRTSTRCAVEVQHVDGLVFDGGHEWTDEFRHAVAGLLNELRSVT